MTRKPPTCLDWGDIDFPYDDSSEPVQSQSVEHQEIIQRLDLIIALLNQLIVNPQDNK